MKREWQNNMPHGFAEPAFMPKHMHRQKEDSWAIPEQSLISGCWAQALVVAIATLPISTAIAVVVASIPTAVSVSIATCLRFCSILRAALGVGALHAGLLECSLQGWDYLGLVVQGRGTKDWLPVTGHPLPTRCGLPTTWKPMHFNSGSKGETIELHVATSHFRYFCRLPFCPSPYLNPRTANAEP